MLDPNDPRPPNRQVANHLRAAILTGEFGAGDRLPTIGQMATMYGVAPMTVQKALAILRKEDLIVSRQGSGVFVKGTTLPSVGLAARLDAAFESDEVSIDYAGFTAELLSDALVEPVDKMRRGRYAPENVTLRLLVADATTPWSLPVDAQSGTDVPAYRRSTQRTIARGAVQLTETITELVSIGLIGEASAEVRVMNPVPLVELYVINETEAFFGLPPIVAEPVEISGKQREILSPDVADTTLFRHVQRDRDAEPVEHFVGAASAWFESVWARFARPHG